MEAAEIHVLNTQVLEVFSALLADEVVDCVVSTRGCLR